MSALAEASEALDFKRLSEAVEFQRVSQEAESLNRTNGLEWLRFRDGDQWPAYAAQSRGLDRPQITVNKVDTFCTQVENQQRQQRPRIKVNAASGTASKKVAEVLKGMIRHIESRNGGADLAYDGGFSSAVTMGWGYWRVLADYVREDSFDQEIYLAPIDNPFSINFDPNSTLPDGSDQERCLVSDVMSKRAFKIEYPNCDDGAGFSPGDSAGYADWVTKESIRIGEFFKIDRDRQKLLRLSDGSTVWADKLRNGLLDSLGLQVIGERISYRRKVIWRKQTALEVIEEKVLPGRWIPIVPCYGKMTIIDGKRKYSGLVKNAMDAQRMSNFWRTAATEHMALAPKAKWVMAEGQDEGHENEWARANTAPTQVLTYRQVDVDGKQAPSPQRIQPEPPPEGTMAMLQVVDQDLTSVLGIIDPAIRIGGNVSGKALNAERLQSDNSNFHFYDNLTRSIRHTGAIILDWIPHYYNEERVVRIIGDDGRPSTKTINQKNPSPGPDTPGPVEEILNDVTVGEYEIEMDTGPGYNTKRQEAVESMMPLFERHEPLMEKAGDILFRNMDFSGSDVIADRLAAANPLAQIDEADEVPPAAQMKIKQLQNQLQQAGQQMQAMQLQLKSRSDVESLKQDGATRRELIKAHTSIHVEDQENQAWMHDVGEREKTRRRDTDVRSQTALSVAEINAVRELLKTRVNNEHDLTKLERIANHEEREEASAERASEA